MICYTCTYRHWAAAVSFARARARAQCTARVQHLHAHTARTRTPPRATCRTKPRYITPVICDALGGSCCTPDFLTQCTDNPNGCTTPAPTPPAPGPGGPGAAPEQGGESGPLLADQSLPPAAARGLGPRAREQRCTPPSWPRAGCSFPDGWCARHLQAVPPAGPSTSYCSAPEDSVRPRKHTRARRGRGARSGQERGRAEGRLHVDTADVGGGLAYKYGTRAPDTSEFAQDEEQEPWYVHPHVEHWVRLRRILRRMRSPAANILIIRRSSVQPATRRLTPHSKDSGARCVHTPRARFGSRRCPPVCTCTLSAERGRGPGL